MRSFLIVLCAGCARVECGEGTTLIDGMCTVDAPAPDTDTGDPPGDVTIEDALESLPACEPSEGDGRVDLDAGCADDACASMTAAELAVAIGEEPDCDRSQFSSGVVYCQWRGIWASFDDLDDDGAPDAASIAGTLFLEAPYEGATVDGLGVGASTSCFFDALGPADSISLWNDGDGYFVASASWWEPDLYVSDFFGAGEVDTLAIAGPGRGSN